MPTCSICSEVLGAELSAAICGHVYHTVCITNWLNQKPSCPLCKHKLTPQQLTALHFAPKHKLAQLQQQHLEAAAADPADAPSSSPFTLHLRLQALRAHVESLDLRLEQSTERLTAVTSQLHALNDTYRTVARDWEAASLREQRALAELHSQQQSLDAKSRELQRLHAQHRSAYRQLLALRTLPALRRRRSASTADLHPTDLQLLVQQADTALPSSVHGAWRDEQRSALRDAALCAVLGVAVAEAKAELEALDGQAAGMKARRKRVTELQREEERLQRELDRTKQQVAQLEEQKATLLKRETRAHSNPTTSDQAEDTALHEVRRTSTSDVTPLRKRKLSQLSSVQPAERTEQGDVIVLSD